MKKEKQKYYWWPFWVILALYAVIRAMFVAPGSPLLVYVVVFFDPITLLVAVLVGIGARRLAPKSAGS